MDAKPEASPVSTVPEASPVSTVPEQSPASTAHEDEKSRKKASFLKRRQIWLKKKLKRVAEAPGKPNSFTYEHMLLRYGEWRSIRAQMFAYFVIMFAACFHKAHGDLLHDVGRLETISVGRHIQCCCDENRWLTYAKKLGHLFGIDHPLHNVILMVAGIFSLTCPIWEKHFGRRKVLGIACLMGIFTSICSCFSAAPALRITWSTGFALINVLIMMISVATLTEMLPYNIRYMAVVGYLYCSGICNAIAVLHFRSGVVDPKASYLGVMSAVFYGIGVISVLFFARESIIHLVIRNKSDVVEKMILRKELKLFERGSHLAEDSEARHREIAKIIFYDLVYLDRDEPKMGKFFKKLYSNWVIVEIVLAFFQSISAGIIEYEFHHFWTEHFADLFIVNAIFITGMAITCLIMFLMRKTHRIKALQWLFAACVVATCLRHVVVQMDELNHCSSSHFYKPEYRWFTALVGSLTVGLGSSLQTMIMIHFLETTPSILRPICVMIVWIPIKYTHVICKAIFGENGVETAQWIVPVYLYHLLIIIITMMRSRSKERLQFSLHLFDLMPQDSHSESDKEEELEKEKLAMTTAIEGQPETSEARTRRIDKTMKLSI